jgi:hypothetical protein
VRDPDPPLSPASLTTDVAFSTIGRLEAGEVAVSRSAVGGIRGEAVSVELGALGGAAAERIQVGQAVVGGLLGDAVETEQVLAGAIVARRVTFRRASGAVVLVAARVDGDVRTVLDWRGALAAGAAAGLVVALLRRLR